MSSNYFEFVEEIPNYFDSTGAQDSRQFKFADSESRFIFYIIRQQSIKYLDDCLMIYLHKPSNENIEAKLLSKISILDANDRKVNTQIIEANFTVENQYSPIRGGVYFIQRKQILDPKNGLLVDGKLRIHFEVELLKDQNSSSKILTSKDKTIDINPNEKALEDYQSLLENSKHSDVVFVVGGKQFKLHKAILSARSPVIGAMFDSDLEESKKNRVEITDVEVQVFEELLRFIYGGKVEAMEQYAEDLFVVADKYQLESLKNLCEQSLSNNLTVETVTQVLTLADMHNAAKLKSNCIQFITSNASKVISTEGWKLLAKDLLMQLYEDMTKKFGKK